MAPELTVVLVVGERRDRAASALASVLAQGLGEALEVIVCDCAPDAPGLPGAAHPGGRRRARPRLLLAPAARFEHLTDSRLGSVMHGCFLFHRCYGPARAEAFGWPAWRRLGYAAATPLIPFYFLARLLLVLAG